MCSSDVFSDSLVGCCNDDITHVQRRKKCHQTLQVCTVFTDSSAHANCVIQSNLILARSPLYLPLYSGILPFLHPMFTFARQSALLIVMTYWMPYIPYLLFDPLSAAEGTSEIISTKMSPKIELGFWADRELIDFLVN